MLSVDERVHEYLESVAPQKLSPGVRRKIMQEYRNHICERMEFYIGIGYDTQVACDKALEDMGETSQVRREFEKLYSDSSVLAVIVGLVLPLFGYLGMFLGFVVFTFDPWFDPDTLHVLFSSLYVLLFAVLVVHAKRRRMARMLTAVSISTLIIALLFIFLSSLAQPFLYGIAYDAAYLMELCLGLPMNPEKYNTWGYIILHSAVFYGSPLLYLIFSASSFSGVRKISKMKSLSEPPKGKKHRVSTWALAVISVIAAAAIGICFEVGTSYYSGKHTWFNEKIISYKMGRSVDEAFGGAYAAVDGDMTLKEADSCISDFGFKRADEYSKSLSDPYSTCTAFYYDMYQHESEDGSEIAVAYCLPEYADFFDRRGLFLVIEGKPDGKVTSKAVYAVRSDEYSKLKKVWVYNAYEGFAELKVDCDTETALKLLGSDVILESCQTRFIGDSEYEKYIFRITEASGGENNYGTQARIELCFENGRLLYARFYGWGSDKKYNYDKMGEVTVGDPTDYSSISADS